MQQANGIFYVKSTPLIVRTRICLGSYLLKINELQKSLISKFSNRFQAKILANSTLTILSKNFLFKHQNASDFENNFKNRVSIIGEPFIRAKLYELIASKSGITVIDEIIEQRNSEIENLRLIRSKKENDKNRNS